MADSNGLPAGFELDTAPLPAELPTPQGVPELPPGFALDEPPKDSPSIGRRMVQRFLGTDVDDPLELTRMGTSIVGMIGGGIAGSRIPALPGPVALFPQGLPCHVIS